MHTLLLEENKIVILMILIQNAHSINQKNVVGIKDPDHDQLAADRPNIAIVTTKSVVAPEHCLTIVLSMDRVVSIPAADQLHRVIGQLQRIGIDHTNMSGEEGVHLHRQIRHQQHHRI